MSATTRSGLLFATFAFLTNLGLGVLFPLCTPLCGIVWGLGAGVVTVAWSNSATVHGTPARNGAIAGLLAGIGAIAGMLIGMVLQYSVLGGQQLATDLAREWGYTAPDDVLFPFAQWIGVALVACCLGLANLAIMAGAGAGGAAVYGSRYGGQSQAAAG